MDWLLRRLADRLGVKPPQSGEAIVPQIKFEQPWSQAGLLLVVLGSIALIIWLYRREGSAPLWYKMGLAALRIALVLLAVFMLSEAVLSVERTGLPYFVVMADDSSSAGVVDQYADPKVKQTAEELAKIAGKTKANRLAVAQGLLAKGEGETLRELQKQHKVKLYLVSASTRPLAEIDQPEEVKPALEKLLKVEPTGAQSRLGDGVRQVLTELRGVPPTAILLLTDGETTDGESLASAAELARRKGVPLYTVGLGDPEPARDLELSDLMVDEVVFVDDLVRFEAKLSSRGFAGQEVTVHLRQKDPQPGNPNAVKDLESIRVPAPPDGQPRRVELGHRPKKTGEVTFILEVEPRPRELQTDNNAIVRTINVREEKLRVLLVDGLPRYEFRYLKTLLERDSTIDLNVVLQSADPEFSEQDKAAIGNFPAAKEGPDGLYSYDVVIFGDVDVSFLSSSQMQNLVDFVTQKGGGVMFIAGEHYNPLTYKRTPLEPLLPIQLAEARNPAAAGVAIAAFRPALTVEGRTHPIFRFGDDEATSARIWQELPELNWFFEAPRKAPAAFVLAEHPQQTGPEGKLPLMLYHFVGAGKVMFNAVDDTWRWRYRVGNRYFGRYWIQTIRFLARSKLLGQKQAEIVTDRRRYQRGQPVQIQVRFPNPGLAPKSGELTVQVERKGQGPRRLSLQSSPNARNVFEGAMPGGPEGEYTVRLLPPPVLEGGMPTTTFRIDAPAGEFERVQMNEPELRRAASASGGKFYTPVTTATLLKDLPAPQKVPLDTD
ncbi:MAG: VWA domain-containing protein, partial [Isosphaeraceae bacterium]|nr:VWA domain-containing protein [Isosphaeraceae bacterium]